MQINQASKDVTDAKEQIGIDVKAWSAKPYIECCGLDHPDRSICKVP